MLLFSVIAKPKAVATQQFGKLRKNGFVLESFGMVCRATCRATLAAKGFMQ